MYNLSLIGITQLWLADMDSDRQLAENAGLGYYDIQDFLTMKHD